MLPPGDSGGRCAGEAADGFGGAAYPSSTSFLCSRQVTARLDRFPDATAEDLQRSDGVCIICREEMSAAGTNKKLFCGHVFHLHCLRSWLERQQNCPTCRGSVFHRPPPPQQQQAAAAPAAPEAPAAAAEGGGVAAAQQVPAVCLHRLNPILGPHWCFSNILLPSFFRVSLHRLLTMGRRRGIPISTPTSTLTSHTTSIWGTSALASASWPTARVPPLRLPLLLEQLPQDSSLRCQQAHHSNRPVLLPVPVVVAVVASGAASTRSCCRRTPSQRPSFSTP